MVFLLAVFKGVLVGLPLWPGGNGKKLKFPEVPTEFTGRQDLDGFPGLSTNRAHLAIGAASVHTGHTLLQITDQWIGLVVTGLERVHQVHSTFHMHEHACNIHVQWNLTYTDPSYPAALIIQTPQSTTLMIFTMFSIESFH